MRNPYDVLGIARNASAADIKSAYRRMAKRYHPDKNPGDESAADSFRAAKMAYDQLTSPKDIGDVFATFEARHWDIKSDPLPGISVPLADLMNGVDVSVKLAGRAVTGSVNISTHAMLAPMCKGGVLSFMSDIDGIRTTVTAINPEGVHVQPDGTIAQAVTVDLHEILSGEVTLTSFYGRRFRIKTNKIPLITDIRVTIPGAGAMTKSGRGKLIFGLSARMPDLTKLDDPTLECIKRACGE